VPDGAAKNAKALVDELRQLSPESDSMSYDNDVGSSYRDLTQYAHHPHAGTIALDYTSFAVGGRPDLGLVIYNPATPADAERIRSLLSLAPVSETARVEQLHLGVPRPAPNAQRERAS
jgi:hypothetical protein